MNSPAAAPASASQWSPGNRIAIEDIWPRIEDGRYPVKRVVGDRLEVWVDLFRDGHDILRAAILHKAADETEWQETPLAPFENDRWTGSFPLERNTRYLYTVEAWTDRFASWRSDVQKKIAAAQPVVLEMIEGRALVRETAEQAGDAALSAMADGLGTADPAAGYDVLLGDELLALMRRHEPRADRTRYRDVLEVVVDRKRAACAAWYEMFPRSQGKDPAKGSTFDDCIARLPEIAALGFDVLYFVPIHPIGEVNRKGANNSLTAQPGEPGSPYAIGSKAGGHDAVNPELGTIDDFDRLVAACAEHDMEVALDFAIQCAPDHPWIKQHPEWFSFRPDGSLRYAENPPKKYQDITNVEFYGPHREALWNALRDVILFWVGHGVKIFRVDNPHTKALPFWEWVIREVQTAHPEVAFLSEAFTRPKMMKNLARIGFTQSYTYFTWRNTKAEIIEYMTELTRTEMREYYRPNFFPTTPDILPRYLQTSGRPGFMVRGALAALLSPLYGIYNGFELCEAAALPNSEEYIDSEKYQYKVWDWDRPGNIKPFLQKLNEIRRAHPVLQTLSNLRFLPAHDESVLFFERTGPDPVYVLVNLDPHNARDPWIELPLSELGIGFDEPFQVEDLLSGHRFEWRGAARHYRLTPAENPVAVFRLPRAGA